MFDNVITRSGRIGKFVCETGYDLEECLITFDGNVYHSFHPFELREFYEVEQIAKECMIFLMEEYGICEEVAINKLHAYYIRNKHVEDDYFELFDAFVSYCNERGFFNVLKLGGVIEC